MNIYCFAKKGNTVKEGPPIIITNTTLGIWPKNNGQKKNGGKKGK